MLKDPLKAVWTIVRIPASLAGAVSDAGNDPPPKECRGAVARELTKSERVRSLH